MIPPHGCWQCKAEFDNLDTEERVGFWQAFASLWLNDVDLAVEMAEQWVDEHFAEDHKFHKPESWIGE